MHDVIVIGAGVTGCAAARELSGYSLGILVLEKESDVSCGASKANSGIIHAGYDCVPGSRKASLNVRGVGLYEGLVRELEIPYRNNGSLVICLNEDEIPRLRLLYENGIKNGVSGLSLLSGAEARGLEPNLNENAKAALLAETAGVISPYEATIAFAENACANGAAFLFDAEVSGITKSKGIYRVETNCGVFYSKAVVNAAGLHCAEIHEFISEIKEEINPQRGQYYILDNTQKNLVTRTIFQLPTRLGKGVLIVPTVDGNILLGPTAEAAEGPDDTKTTREGLDDAYEKAKLLLSSVPLRDRITAFAGIRAKHSSGDFIIRETLPGFIEAIGIDSPGLSAAPAIALEIADFVINYLRPKKNKNFNGRREGIKRFKNLPFEEQRRRINENPSYGRVVCRCETVTEAEVIEAVRRKPGARDLDAVKRRTRAQMGRCQGGFCTPRLTEILGRELGIDESEATKSGTGSWLTS